MGIESKAVLATTTLAKEDSHIERVRGVLALRTVYEARRRDHDIVVVDGGSPDWFVTELLQLGADVKWQEAPGMGAARRQSLRLAKEVAEDKNLAVVWLEPEKCNLIPHVQSAASLITDRGYDLVMFRRKSLDSYPPEQRCSYELGRLAAKYYASIDADFYFGPIAISPRATDYFLMYRSLYGDLWDGLHIPKLHIINDKLPWTQLVVDYKHPKEQTDAETGDITLFEKRIEQINHIIHALSEEVKRLNNPHFKEVEQYHEDESNVVQLWSESA